MGFHGFWWVIWSKEAGIIEKGWEKFSLQLKRRRQTLKEEKESKKRLEETKGKFLIFDEKEDFVPVSRYLGIEIVDY